jgi:hypothetical protein
MRKQHDRAGALRQPQRAMQHCLTGRNTNQTFFDHWLFRFNHCATLDREWDIDALHNAEQN